MFNFNIYPFILYGFDDRQKSIIHQYSHIKLSQALTGENKEFMFVDDREIERSSANVESRPQRI